MEWRVLTWNAPAIDFYHKLGAKQLTDWHTMELRGAALSPGPRSTEWLTRVST